MAITSKIEKINNKIDVIKKPLFMGILFVWHLLYFMVFFGIVYINSSYIHTLSVVIQLFIGAFLLFRFHPFRTYAVSKFDAMVIFSSASFLMTNLLTTELLGPYLSRIESYMRGIVQGIPKSTLSSNSVPSSVPSRTSSITTLPTNIHRGNILSVPV